MARRSAPQPDDAPVRPWVLIGLPLAWIGFLLVGFGIARTAIRQHPVLWSEIVRYGGGLDEGRARAIWTPLEVLPTARRGMRLTELGLRFTRAWRGPDDPAGLLHRIQQSAGRKPLASTATARLYEIAACLLVADRSPEQREAALSRVRTLVAQLVDQPLPHDLAETASALAMSLSSRLLQYTGGSRRDAERLAVMELGQPHGPVVEYLAPRLVELAGTLESQGDSASANAVRRLTYHWLISWVREPGPPALRVLAADVLADVLETDPTFGAEPEWIRGLRELRREYRDYVEHEAPTPERIRGSPQWRQQAARDLIARLARTVWMASAALLAGTIGALLTLAALARGVPRPSKEAIRHYPTAAVVAALLLWVAGWAAVVAGWIRLPDALPDQAATLRSMTPAALGGAASAAVVCGVAVLVIRPPSVAKLALLMLWLSLCSGVGFQASGLMLSGSAAASGRQAGERESLLGRLPGSRSERILASLPERLPPR